MPSRNFLLLLALGNLLVLLLFWAMANQNQDDDLAADTEMDDAVIEADPFGNDGMSRSSNSANISPPRFLPEVAATLTANPPAIAAPKPLILPADETPKPPYVFPTPIFIPSFYFDSTAPTPRPRATPTPTRRR